jgi:FkbM family methyltransferase
MAGSAPVHVAHRFPVPPGMVEVEKHGMMLLVYDEHTTQCRYLRKGEQEDGVIDYLRKVVAPGDIVADIGAHVGFYTCLLSQLVGAKGHVLAFEPEMQHATALALNVLRNECANVTVLPCACGGETAKVLFPLGACGDQRPGYGEQRAWQVRLEDVCAALDGFKMDTQGGEVEILDGMGDVLRGARWAVVEHHGDMSFANVLTRIGLASAGDARKEQFFFERSHV